MIREAEVDGDGTPSERRGLASWASLVFASLLLLCVMWAIASPVGSGPDESGHIMKAAATVRGDLVGSPTSEPGIRSFLLPADVGALDGAVICFAARPNQTAACAPALGSLPDTVVEVESGVASYNPVYYMLVGWPSLFLDGGTMVMAMRLINAVIVAGLWTFVIVALCFRRPRAVLFVSLALTPLALYLGGVVNPSGIEAAGTAAVLVLVDAVVIGRGKHTIWLPVLLGVVLGLLINLRSISPLFAALAVVAVIAIRGPALLWAGVRRREIFAMILALVPAALFAVGWTLLVSQPAGFIPSTDQRRPGRAEAFFHSLVNFPSQFTEMTGVMGWFDARPPDAVHLIWAALVSGAVLVAILVARPRHALTVLGFGALLFLLPAAIQALSANGFGYIWQGRYSLPLLAILMIVASLSVEAAHRPPSAVGRFTAVAVVLVALQVWTFIVVLKRYAVGADADWALWSTDSAWQPPGGAILVCSAFAIGAGLLIAALALNARRTLGDRRTTVGVVAPVHEPG